MIIDAIGSNKPFFETLCIENSPEGYDGLPINLVNWSIQSWRCLNWKITDKFNWHVLTRQGDEIQQAHSRGWIHVRIETCVSQALVHQQRQIRPRLAKRAVKQVFYEFQSHGESWRGEISDVQRSLTKSVDRFVQGLCVTMDQRLATTHHLRSVMRFWLSGCFLGFLLHFRVSTFFFAL